MCLTRFFIYDLGSLRSADVNSDIALAFNSEFSAFASPANENEVDDGHFAIGTIIPKADSGTGK